MALNSWCSCLYFLSARITSVAIPTRWCGAGESKPGFCARLATTLNWASATALRSHSNYKTAGLNLLLYMCVQAHMCTCAWRSTWVAFLYHSVPYILRQNSRSLSCPQCYRYRCHHTWFFCRSMSMLSRQAFINWTISPAFNSKSLKSFLTIYEFLSSHEFILFTKEMLRVIEG